MKQFVCSLMWVLVLGVSAAAAQDGPRVVHVFVALADNQAQGIVPVPAKLGNGDDADHNLYWGAGYGVRTFFSRSRDWKRLGCERDPKAGVLERCIFEHQRSRAVLVADAYRGRNIEQSITEFLRAAAGGGVERVAARSGAREVAVTAGGGASLLVYVGHDGLMDFQLSELPRQQNDARREVIILACMSKRYFSAPVHATGAQPLLWTTGLMAPEAYTLKSALDGWFVNERPEQMRERAAAAYHQYQHTGLRAARKLLVTGW